MKHSNKCVLAALIALSGLLFSCGGGQKNNSSSPVDSGSSSSRSVIPPDAEGNITIRFYNGDQLLKTLTGKPGDPVVGAPSNPREDGHAFTGWATSPTGTGTKNIAVFPEISTDYYAQFKKETYVITFEEYPEYNGEYQYDDPLPGPETNVVFEFYGWRWKEEQVGVPFKTCPDLGWADGEELTFVPVSVSHVLTIHFSMPSLHSAIEDIVTEDPNVLLPSNVGKQDVAGKMLNGWSLVEGESGYGAEEEGATCVEHLSEASALENYLVETGDEDNRAYEVTLYPLRAEKTYFITFLDYDGSSFENPNVLRSGGTFRYGDALPEFEQYQTARGGEVGTFIALTGWSLTKGLNQTGSAVMKSVSRDFGADGVNVILYAVPANPTYEISFMSPGEDYGKYSNGKESFTSNSYQLDEELPAWIPNPGFGYGDGYYVLEEIARPRTLYTRVPNLLDETKFTQESGTFRFVPAADFLQFKFEELDADLPSLSAFSRARPVANVLWAGDAGVTDLVMDSRLIRKQGSSDAVTWSDGYIARGHEIGSVDIQGFSRTSGTWKTVKAGVSENALPGIAQSVVNGYSKWRLSLNWDPERYVVFLYQQGPNDSAPVLSKTSYLTMTYGSYEFQYTDVDKNEIGWAGMLSERKLTGLESAYRYLYIDAKLYSGETIRLTENLYGGYSTKNRLKNAWSYDQTLLEGDTNTATITWAYLHYSNYEI